MYEVIKTVQLSPVDFAPLPVFMSLFCVCKIWCFLKKKSIWPSRFPQFLYICHTEMFQVIALISIRDKDNSTEHKMHIWWFHLIKAKEAENVLTLCSVFSIFVRTGLSSELLVCILMTMSYTVLMKYYNIYIFLTVRHDYNLIELTFW